MARLNKTSHLKPMGDITCWDERLSWLAGTGWYIHPSVCPSV